MTSYYVSIVRDPGTPAQRTGLLAGPFPTHQEALDLVPRATALACEVDPWAAFDAFGTVRMADDYQKPGVLNAHLEVEPPEPAHTDYRANLLVWCPVCGASKGEPCHD